ncbi:NADH:ubiquinone oxidoreductase subunit NDUFA12 [Kiloniella sp. b19]|uniref:NADH:ubiquinone oxidoreductase subunit NDUFA12 n=1 Tax=Kiloniella sp. GXU_MW_B19 TaxID=3141326 RepID=UPI0031DDC985
MSKATIGTRLYTWAKGELVGEDKQGNKYYRTKGGSEMHKDSLRKERRWVIYNGDVEASRVPADWHAWLHHTVNELPPKEGLPRYDWMKDHQQNMTGTDQAYRPGGSPYAGGQRERVSSDYDAWQPE